MSSNFGYTSSLPLPDATPFSNYAGGGSTPFAAASPNGNAMSDPTAPGAAAAPGLISGAGGGSGAGAGGFSGANGALLPSLDPSVINAPYTPLQMQPLQQRRSLADVLPPDQTPQDLGHTSGAGGVAYLLNQALRGVIQGHQQGVVAQQQKFNNNMESMQRNYNDQQQQYIAGVKNGSFIQHDDQGNVVYGPDGQAQLNDQGKAAMLDRDNSRKHLNDYVHSYLDPIVKPQKGQGGRKPAQPQAGTAPAGAAGAAGTAPAPVAPGIGGGNGIGGPGAPPPIDTTGLPGHPSTVPQTPADQLSAQTQAHARGQSLWQRIQNIHQNPHDGAQALLDASDALGSSSDFQAAPFLSKQFQEQRLAQGRAASETTASTGGAAHVQYLKQQAADEMSRETPGTPAYNAARQRAIDLDQITSTYKMTPFAVQQAQAFGVKQHDVGAPGGQYAGQPVWVQKDMATGQRVPGAVEVPIAASELPPNYYKMSPQQQDEYWRNQGQTPGQGLTASQGLASIAAARTDAAPTVHTSGTTVAYNDALGAMAPTTRESESKKTFGSVGGGNGATIPSAAIAASATTSAAAPVPTPAPGSPIHPTDTAASQFISPSFRPGATPHGMTSPGNIPITAMKPADYANALTVPNGKGGQVLIPTVGPDGKSLNPAEALAQFKQSGQNYGTFKTSQLAHAYQTVSRSGSVATPEPSTTPTHPQPGQSGQQTTIPPPKAAPQAPPPAAGESADENGDYPIQKIPKAGGGFSSIVRLQPNKDDLKAIAPQMSGYAAFGALSDVIRKDMALRQNTPPGTNMTALNNSLASGMTMALDHRFNQGVAEGFKVPANYQAQIDNWLEMAKSGQMSVEQLRGIQQTATSWRDADKEQVNKLYTGQGFAPKYSVVDPPHHGAPITDAAAHAYKEASGGNRAKAERWAKRDGWAF